MLGTNVRLRIAPCSMVAAVSLVGSRVASLKLAVKPAVKSVARRIEIHRMVVSNNNSGGRRVDRPPERPWGGGGDGGGDGDRDDDWLQGVSRFRFVGRLCSPYHTDISISSPTRNIVAYITVHR